MRGNNSSANLVYLVRYPSLEVHNLARQIRHAVKLAVQRSPHAPVVKLVMQRRAPLAPALKLGRKEGSERAARSLPSAKGTALLQSCRLLDSLTHSINSVIEVDLLVAAVR